MKSKRASRSIGILKCSMCQIKVSVDEFNANNGYCDECREGKNDDTVLDYVKSGKWDKNGRRDEDLTERRR